MLRNGGSGTGRTLLPPHLQIVASWIFQLHPRAVIPSIIYRQNRVAFQPVATLVFYLSQKSSLSETEDWQADRPSRGLIDLPFQSTPSK